MARGEMVRYLAQNNVYDLNGSKVANPQKGQIYIINGKKRIFIN